MRTKNVQKSSFRAHGSGVFSGRPTACGLARYGTLTHPNGLTLTQSYDATRDLPTDMSYSRADALVVQRAYTYDKLGRPTARNLARYGTETQDTFGYNTRSELTSAHVNSADYSYAYDAIGNRTAATEAGTRTAHTANKLNQYTAEGSFRPTFDADGNQTLIKTSTGTWNVTYNAKNRPILFTKSDGSVTVECTYDTMGRRATKKVTTNGTLTEHRRFLYRGYLQIACCDLTRAYTPALWFITWDPTQPTATRPLAIQKNGTWYTYGWDLTKNICETYRTDGRIDLAYTYTPYGEVSPAHTYDQPIRWSSEYHDVELGLVYYNYRHYNPAMGRWMGRDIIAESNDAALYEYCVNNPALFSDELGMKTSDQKKDDSYNARARQRVGKTLNQEKQNQNLISQLSKGSSNTIKGNKTVTPATTSLLNSMMEQYLFFKSVQDTSTIFSIMKNIEKLCLNAKRSTQNTENATEGCCVVRFEILLVVNRPECILSNHSILYYPRSCNCTDFIEPNRHDLRIEHVKIPMSEDNVLIN